MSWSTLKHQSICSAYWNSIAQSAGKLFKDTELPLESAYICRKYTFQDSFHALKTSLICPVCPYGAAPCTLSSEHAVQHGRTIPGSKTL